MGFEQDSRAMNDPLARGASYAPQTIGEGCTSRYDPDALSDEHGAEFSEAAALWRQLQPIALLSADEPASPTPDNAD
jgi:hypothetical protein